MTLTVLPNIDNYPFISKFLNKVLKSNSREHWMRDHFNLVWLLGKVLAKNHALTGRCAAFLSFAKREDFGQ